MERTKKTKNELLMSRRMHQLMMFSGACHRFQPSAQMKTGTTAMQSSVRMDIETDRPAKYKEQGSHVKFARCSQRFLFRFSRSHKPNKKHARVSWCRLSPSAHVIMMIAFGCMLPTQASQHAAHA